jgi:hypothetical protein
MSDNKSEVNNRSLLSIIRMILSSSFSGSKYLLDPAIWLLHQGSRLILGVLNVCYLTLYDLGRPFDKGLCRM